MRKIKIKWHVGGSLMLTLFCLILSAGNCRAESLNVKEVVGNAGKYSDRQIQVEGRVERWVELGGGEKNGLYILKDNYGDEIQVKTTEKMPPVGDTVSVKGLLILDSKQNKYYLQSLQNTQDINQVKENNNKNNTNPSLPGSLLTYNISTARKLIVVAAVAVAVFLFIGVIAVRVRRGKKIVIDVPDFSFDETETIKIDVNGQCLGSVTGAASGESNDDESTMVLMPGYFKITKGSKELDGQTYYLTSALTRVGRQESTVNKESGWIAFPSTCATISRHQADLLFNDGSFYVENRSRATVTRVNGIPLSFGDSCKLSDKDVLAFSEIELTYLRDR
jgi:FHA domain